MIFERLWRESGCQAVVEAALTGRQFQFPVERAVFASVLHRLCVSGSDRACDSWLEGYRVCVVADRGMISAETLAELGARGIDSILGTRERTNTEVRDVVLADAKPMVPLSIPRAGGATTDLDRLVETTVDQDGRRFVLRTQVSGCAGEVFQAVRVALPPLFRRINSDGTDPPSEPAHPKPRKQRLTPRKRSATPDSKNGFSPSEQ